MDDGLITESRAWGEFLALRGDPVYRGEGVPRGDGQPVLVLPGLFGNDLYLHPIRRWLERIGYRPLPSSIALNVGCPERLKTRLARTIERRLDGSGELSIIGHSRGGLLGKALAARLGARCACLVTLGSPLGALMTGGREGLVMLAAGRHAGAESVAADAVVDAGRRAMRLFSPSCEFPDCACSYVDELLAPLADATRVYAIYSTEDPVVAPEASPIPGGVNIEVSGTHSGLVVNRSVYQHLGRVLAGMI